MKLPQFRLRTVVIGIAVLSPLMALGALIAKLPEPRRGEVILMAYSGAACVPLYYLVLYLLAK
jgi:hypothetical protein